MSEAPEPGVDDGASAEDEAEAEERIPDIPADAVAEAERLTRLARAAERREDEDADAEAAAYRERREELVAEHGYESRHREADDTLVLYPAEWLDAGVVQVERIEETERAVELSLSGPGDPEHWAETEAHNAALVDAVAEAHGPDHAANARAFADFLGNHYAKEVEAATVEEVREFLTDYYPRNAWPSEEQAALVEESLRKLFAAADAEAPAPLVD